MKPITDQTLLRAIAILASRRTELGNKWADKGSAMARGREILEHAQEYLYAIAENSCINDCASWVNEACDCLNSKRLC